MKRSVVLSIDVGGTYYKAAVLDARSYEILPGSLFEHPSFSNENRVKILEAFIQVISRGISFLEASAQPLELTRIAFDCPGPFDYVKGQAVMRHKFNAIFGVPLTPIIRSECDISKDIPVVFHHDLHAFTYGVCRFGSGRGFDSVFCVTIGTGLGTGCFRGGRIDMNIDGTPKYPMFEKPYGGGIVEDIVSNRGLTAQYNERCDSDPAVDAKDIELRAISRQDRVAYEVYEEMGRVLGKTLLPVLEQLKIEALIIGGQISKGFELFGDSLRDELVSCESLSLIAPAQDLSSTAIRGCGAIPLSWYEAYREEQP